MATNVSPTPPTPPTGQFLRVWLAVGLQSFGGGPSTLALMRRSVVEQHSWLDDEQFARDWALCQICPGINLLGMCVLIGRKVLGVPGILLALFGLLLPSVFVTVLLSACFRAAYNSTALQAAVRGAIPATVGIGWLTCFHMARGVTATSRRHGPGELVATIALLIASGALFAWLRPSPIFLLLGAGIVCGAWRALRASPGRDAAT